MDYEIDYELDPRSSRKIEIETHIAVCVQYPIFSLIIHHSMNNLKILENPGTRSHSDKVQAQAKVLFKILTESIDLNSVTRRLIIHDMELFDENVQILHKRGVRVEQDVSGNTCTFSW